MDARDVAVTGLGLVTPAGIGVAATWDGVLAGRPAAAVDPELAGHPVRISCRVPGFDPVALVGAKPARRLDRYTQFALVAAREAVADAGLGGAAWDGARVGVVLGTGGYGAATLEAQYGVLRERGPEQLSALLLPMHLNNMAAGQLAIELGVTGPNLAVSTACASGTTALGLARDLLLAGRCDVVIAGGAEAMITPLVVSAFARMGALSTRNDEPALASRPFDVARDGFVTGEGAGLLVLERADDARARGARVRALISGFGASADAHHVTAPPDDGRGLDQALRAALAEAELAPDDIDHVNAHGTSTPKNDLVEAGVLARLFDHLPPVTATKGVTGHMLGAAGAVEAAVAVLTLEHQTVPPTANLTDPDPAMKLDLPTSALPLRMRTAVSQSAGFGGQNAALVLRTA